MCQNVAKLLEEYMNRLEKHDSPPFLTRRDILDKSGSEVEHAKPIPEPNTDWLTKVKKAAEEIDSKHEIKHVLNELIADIEVFLEEIKQCCITEKPEALLKKYKEFQKRLAL